MAVLFARVRFGQLFMVRESYPCDALRLLSALATVSRFAWFMYIGFVSPEVHDSQHY